MAVQWGWNLLSSYQGRFVKGLGSHKVKQWQTKTARNFSESCMIKEIQSQYTIWLCSEQCFHGVGKRSFRVVGNTRGRDVVERHLGADSPSPGTHHHDHYCHLTDSGFISATKRTQNLSTFLYREVHTYVFVQMLLVSLPRV